MVIGYYWLNVPITMGLTTIVPITYNPITRQDLTI
jgi:hypothetical protein